MLTRRGAPGFRRQTRRAASGLAALLGVLAVGLAGGSGSPRPDRLVLAGHGSSAPGAVPGTPSSAGPRRAQTTGSFSIVGRVSGLYPGLTSPLVLTVTNAQAFTIVVTSITTTVRNATGTCTASNLSVGAFSGRLAVPANGSATTSVLASLARSAPGACIGATFPLVYRGLATRAPT